MAEVAGTPPVPKPAGGKRSFWIGVLIGALVTAAIFGAAIALRSGSVGNTAFLLKNARAEGVTQTASGLQYKVLTAGKGARPTDSDVALVTYEGKLLDGTVFDKSQQPAPMPVSGVVPGFSEGLKLMNKGAKYRFWLKPGLGYGDKPAGPIPANSVLAFDVELLDFLPESVVRQMQMQQQMMQAAPAGGATPGPASPGAQPKR